MHRRWIHPIPPNHVLPVRLCTAPNVNIIVNNWRTVATRCAAFGTLHGFHERRLSSYYNLSALQPTGSRQSVITCTIGFSWEGCFLFLGRVDFCVNFRPICTVYLSHNSQPWSSCSPKPRWWGGSRDRAATGVEPATCRSQETGPTPQNTRPPGPDGCFRQIFTCTENNGLKNLASKTTHLLCHSLGPFPRKS